MYANYGRWKFLLLLPGAFLALSLIPFSLPASTYVDTGLFQALAWGLLILQGAFGYSLLTQSLVKKELPSGALLGVGFSIYIALGSLLNLFGLGSDFAIYFVVGTGVVATVTCNIHLPQDGQIFAGVSGSIKSWLFIAVLFLCVMIYVYSFRVLPFNEHDDFHAYLVFPFKFLQLGFIGNDPYNERRLSSAFGGNAFMAAMMLSGAKLQFLHALDLGVARLAIALSLFVIPFGFGRTGNFIKVILMVTVLILVAPAVNITPMFLPILLMLSLWVLMQWACSQGQALSDQMVPMALFVLVLSALCALKNSFIPYGALLSLCYIYCVSQCNLRRLSIAVTLGTLFFITLSPWMIDLYRSSGTVLYPILGQGLHASQYGDFASPRQGLFTDGSFLKDLIGLLMPLYRSLIVFTVGILCCAIYIRIKLGKSKDSVGSIDFLPAITTLIYAISTAILLGGYGTYRFIFSGIVCGLLVTPIFFLQKKLSRSLIFLTLLIPLLFMGHELKGFYLELKNSPSLRFSYTQGKLAFELSEAKKYGEVSDYLPKDGQTIARVSQPFLLKARPNIYVADFPGASSPKPGMPFQKGPQALLEYLRAQGIRYAVWEYSNSAGFPKEKYKDRLALSENPWARSQAERTFDFQDNLEIFRKTLPVIYEANGIAIIDLGK